MKLTCCLHLRSKAIDQASLAFKICCTVNHRMAASGFVSVFSRNKMSVNAFLRSLTFLRTRRCCSFPSSFPFSACSSEKVGVCACSDSAVEFIQPLRGQKRESPSAEQRSNQSVWFNCGSEVRHKEIVCLGALRGRRRSFTLTG